MKIMTTSCTDNITGFMILATDCSYNIAMDWLETEFFKYDIDIVDCKIDSITGYTKIRTVQYGHESDNYYYDEIRGYLLRDFKNITRPY